MERPDRCPLSEEKVRLVGRAICCCYSWSAITYGRNPQEVKRVEIEETSFAMAIIVMMQERILWQGTSDQLKKHFTPT
jgi:hypothetical protein